jgi:hypothetical protein
MLFSGCSTSKMGKSGLKGRFTCIACSALMSVTTTPANCQQAAGVVATQSAAQAATQHPGPAVPNTLMDGTPIRLRLGRTISSASERIGNPVDFEVAEDVKINDVLIIPVGAVALATVTAAEHKKQLGRAGTLELKLDSVRLADGEKAAITATEGGKAGGHVGVMTTAMVATGILFFPAAPLFLFMHGNDMTIPKGAEITAYVNGDVPLTMSRFAPVDSPPPNTSNVPQ